MSTQPSPANLSISIETEKVRKCPLDSTAVAHFTIS